MLSFAGGLKVMLSLEPCDMRKGFEGLSALVQNQLEESPIRGTLFVFTNRDRTRLKILYWDGSGLWVCSKRLEKGTFSWPRACEENQRKLSLRPEALALLTDGVEMKGAKFKPWYEREK